MLNTDIEKLGTSAIEDIISKTDYIVPSVNNEDKGPSWDGNLYVYKTSGNNHKKEDLIRRIPVQVKGCVKRNTKRSSISYSVEVSDLNNYLNDGGAIYFVVYIDENGEKKTIYYKTLLPFDIKLLIKNIGKKRTKTISLKPFPTNKKDITDVLVSCAEHMNRQAPVSRLTNLLSYDDIIKSNTKTELKIYFPSHRAIEKPLDYLFDHETYIYADTPNGITYPISHMINLQSAFRKIIGEVKIAGKTYYNEYSIQIEKNCSTIIIGKSFRFTIAEPYLQCHFSLNGTLSERIQDGEFLISLIEHLDLTINNFQIAKFSLENFRKFRLEEFKKTIYLLKNLKSALAFFDVNEELDIDKLSDEDCTMIGVIIDAYQGKKVRLSDLGQPFGFIRIKNLRFLICTEKDTENGLFKVDNYFNSCYTYLIKTNDDVYHPCPYFVLLNKEDLSSCCNLNIEKIIKQVEAVKYDDVVYDIIVLWILELIKAYDSQTEKNPILLSIALSVINSLKSINPKDNNIILRINELQIIKRQRVLTENEQLELQDIIMDKYEITVKIAAYILLEEYKSARLLLTKLSKEEKKTFCNYPIYSLFCK